MILLLLVAAFACGYALLREPWGALVLGLGLSGALWSAGWLLLGLTGPWTDLALLVLAVVCWRSTGRRSSSSPAVHLVVLAAFGLVMAALFVEHSIRYPEGGWDAVAIWNVRARAIFGAPGNLAQVFSPDVGATHPDYPLLLPGLVAHGWFALGHRTALAPIAVSFLFAAGGVGALCAAVREKRGPAFALAAALLLLGTPDLLALAWNQYADLKLAMLLLLAVVLASDERYLLAGLAAGLAAYTKNEGLIECIALLAAIAAADGPKAAARFLAGAAAPLALLLYFKLRWAPANDFASGSRFVPWRALAIARGYALEIANFEHWGLSLAAVALLWIFRARSRSAGALFVALMLLGFFAMYLFIPGEPRERMRDSIDRLLFQIWPALIYVTALAVSRGPAAPTAAATGRA